MKIIVRVSEDFGIGKDGDLLFPLPPDMKLFRETTLDKVIVMGRKTLDSFPGGRALKNRVNIVLTRDKGFSRENVTALHSVGDVLEYVKKYNTDDVFIIGGAEIYNLFEPLCDEAIVTKVKGKSDADRFFFNIDEKEEWTLYEKSPEMEYEKIKYTVCRYKKA